MLISEISPEPCEENIFKNGKFVTMITGGSSQLIELYINLCSEECGQKMDWHYVGGRAVIKTIGDVEKAKRCLEDNQLRLHLYL